MNTAERQTAIATVALSSGLIQDDCPVIAIIDLDLVTRKANELGAAFPNDWRHRFAVKANTLLPVLGLLHKTGLDMEASSMGEIEACRLAKIPLHALSYSSPVKTRPEIQFALDHSIAISVDSLQELDLLRACLRQSANPPSSDIGLRINPQIGEGQVAATSAAAMTSKFGIAIPDRKSRAKVSDLIHDFPWISFLHVHVGSLNSDFDHMIEGLSTVLDLAREVNNGGKRKKPVKTINIGGGLTVDPDPACGSTSFHHYSARIRDRLPDLVSGEFAVETEFGRSIVAESGILLARVEYVKEAGERQILLTRAGVNVLPRSVLMPEGWPLHLSLLDSTGRVKEGTSILTDVAGPCCFPGDLLRRECFLPHAEPGDVVLIHNVGAYGIGSHYNFNLFPKPPILKAIQAEDHFRFSALDE